MENHDRQKAFASRFTQALQASGNGDYSDGDLAILLSRYGVDVGPKSIAHWRNGRHMPKLHQYVGIARFLKMPVDELAFGTVRVAEARAPYPADDAEERALLEAYALLDEPERAAINALMRALSHRAARQDRRPGPRKQR